MIKEKFYELKKNFSVKNNLFLIFLIVKTNMDLDQIDFNFLKDNTTKIFSFKNEKWEIKNSKKPNAKYKFINIEEVKEPEKIIEKISKPLKNKNLFPNKFMIIIQKVKDLTYTVLCLSEDFYVYKIVMDKDLNIIEEELINLINFFRIK